MRHKKYLDDLSVEEIERYLVIRKREARQGQLKRMRSEGRVIIDSEPVIKPPVVAQPAQSPPPAPVVTPPSSHVAAPATAPLSPVVVGADLPRPAPFELPIAPVDFLNRGSKSEMIVADPMMDLMPAPVVPTRLAVQSAPRFDDDPHYTFDEGQRGSDRVWRGFVNLSLMFVELAAVGGLLFLILNLVDARQELEAETSAAQELAQEIRSAGIPTLEPTPTVRLESVVLPGGHTISESGLVSFNYSEIPSHLLPRLEQQILRPESRRPEPTDQTALRLIIPALNLNQPIIQGTDWEALQQGVGQVLNGSTPGAESGNVVLAAHNDIYGELFEHLPDMEVGDQFQIQTSSATYTYEVEEAYEVDPDEVWVMDVTPGESRATLITCYPYGVNTDRWIVFARRVDANA